MTAEVITLPTPPSAATNPGGAGSAAPVTLANPLSLAPLFEIDEELRACLDTLDLTEEGSAERAELEVIIQQWQAQLPVKVDRTASTYRWLLAMADVAKDEKDFYAKRQAYFTRAAERLEGYCTFVLRQQPEPKKGPRKLHGERHTLQLGTTEVVSAPDEAVVPSRYKTACVEMPAEDWERLVLECPWVLDIIGRKQDLKIRKGDIKRALKDGEEVKGADLVPSYSLQVK